MHLMNWWLNEFERLSVVFDMFTLFAQKLHL